jgi:hypothetical protein
MLILALLVMDIVVGLLVLALSGSWVLALMAYVVCTAISIYVAAV